MRKKIYSTNKNKYPNKYLNFIIINNINEYVEKLLDNNSQIIFATKTTTVLSRNAKLGEIVKTSPAVIVDGKKYTMLETKSKVDKDDVKNGAVIVQNLSGVKMIIGKRDVFEKNYTKQGTGYVSNDGENKFIQIYENICFKKANWNNRMMFVAKNSFLNITNYEDIYGITNCEFDSTYKVR